MSLLFWICVTIPVFQVAQGYVLLTANVDDFQTISNQLLSSPVVEKVQKIWRRASNLFNKAVQDSSRRHYEKSLSDDIRSDIEKMSSPPMLDKLKDIWRRASYIFKKVVTEPTRRHIDDKRGNVEAILSEKDQEIANQLIQDLITVSKDTADYVFKRFSNE